MTMHESQDGPVAAALVGVVMGSSSDWEVMRHAVELLREFEIPVKAEVLSAHRMPFDMLEYGKSAAGRGLKIIIAGAGGAAHLPGMLAASTELPVLGVPVPSRHLAGQDSLLSIVQMPRGIPVATFAIGEAGAVNAALFAIAILALYDQALAVRLEGYRKLQTEAARGHGPARLTGMQPMLAPGSWLGLLGGGQLGRMFAMAAQSLGFRVLLLDPDPNSPASAVCDQQIVAAYDDVLALDRLAERASAITTEFENVPARSLARLASTRLVTPASTSVAIAQDRISEKRFISAAGARVAPHHVITSVADFDAAPASLYPGVLKASRLGYDGKGQARVGNATEARAAFAELKGVACVLEQRLELDYEISVVLARGMDGSTVTYPIADNLHRDGILQVSRVPSPRVLPAIAADAVATATRIASALGYHGAYCVSNSLC